MSLARVYTTKGPVRKDGLKCGKCRKDIVKGVDRRRTFAVGFRGYEQTRCMDAACTPTRSELESSAVASVYDAIDSADLAAAGCADDLTSIRDEIAGAIREVAEEYDNNEMIEVNYDLQERRDMLEAAADELEGWEPEGEAPEEEQVDCYECNGEGTVEDGEENCDECNGTGQVDPDHEQNFDEWMDEQRESLQEAIDGLELP